MKNALSLMLITSLLMVLISCDKEVDKSIDFTEEFLFTEGIEGPAVDSEKNLYAVNFEKEGSIGIVNEKGQASLFVMLPNGSIGNGIRFDKDDNMFIADYVNREVELYYGTRTADDMYDYDKYINLTKNQRFKFYPALSEINEILHHPGVVIFDIGFISYQIEKRLENEENCEAYLCGPPVMVDAAIMSLI